MEPDKSNQKMKADKFSLFIVLLMVMGIFFSSGFYGIKVVVFIALFCFPFYLILSLFNFSLSERILFALFISLAFFSLLVYWVGQIIYSYRISIIVTYIILILTYFIIKKFKGGDKN